ncbi:ATP-binding protein [Acinetobacter towneri]|uniref:ATP-binding protein n=1 Tax=Acinetobacter towneri TaxID=202956 RepID=UPI001436CBF6|nr:ATP-binding protein [Acinetobacter towneri]MCA4814132.1 ATP-binding protein [Acinetobacter towneri]QIV93194.1 ATP-binding protein [Acinetobacter towneri]
MDDIKLLMPSAASILQSMRDIGYTLDTAIADIIDNSIAAAATQIDIIVNERPEPQFMIIDNGHGMGADELYQALRFATKPPTEIRSDRDLGRFGLGLKTASFSQARRLTVISSKAGQFCAAQWDLDYVIEHDKWLLKIIDPARLHIDQIYLEKITEHGTIVIWDQIDRIEFSGQETEAQRYLSQLLTKLREHLGLVFHKFIEGTAKTDQIKITLNHIEIPAFNPFCLSNKFTRVIGVEKVFLNDSEVTIQAYALPHYSNMTPQEYEMFRKRSDLLNNQGTYVYRNDRLMVWGGWFRIIPKSEQTKYSRVEINFDKSIDHLWTIDIKKSKASPPFAVIQILKQIIGQITGTSVKMTTTRVSKSLETKESPWNRYSGDGVSYRVNQNYPLFQTLLNSMSVEQRKHFHALIEVIESSLPVQGIYSDMAVNPKQVILHNHNEDNIKGLKEKFLNFAEFMEAKKMDKDVLREASISSGLFSGNLENLNRWVEEYYA